jgi:hypothetical protein
MTGLVTSVTADGAISVACESGHSEDRVSLDRVMSIEPLPPRTAASAARGAATSNAMVRG